MTNSAKTLALRAIESTRTAAHLDACAQHTLMVAEMVGCEPRQLSSRPYRDDAARVVMPARRARRMRRAKRLAAPIVHYATAPGVSPAEARAMRNARKRARKARAR